MAKHRIIVSVPSGKKKEEEPEPKKKGHIFTPANPENSWGEFVAGHMITGFFIALGTVIGTVVIKGLIKKHYADKHEDSFVAKGLG
jgi:hypothetical protein